MKETEFKLIFKQVDPIIVFWRVGQALLTQVLERGQLAITESKGLDMYLWSLGFKFQLLLSVKVRDHLYWLAMAV